MHKNLHEWDKIEEKTIIPGLHAKFIHSANMTFALWRIEAGALLPEHDHPHEQVAHLLSGTFELTIDGTPFSMPEGSVAIIPSHARHSGKALTECRILDAFYPVREDYLKSMGQSLLQTANELVTD